MTRLASSRGKRRGYTLVEVALATVTGTVLLISLAYTSRELQRAVGAVYGEALLQTVVRDLQGSLDSQIQTKLSALASASGTHVQLDMNNFASGNMTMQLGPNYYLRFVESTNPFSPGGQLMSSSDGVNWQPVIGIGAREMLDQSNFGYATYFSSAESAPPSDAIVFNIDGRVKEDLVRINNRMARSELVPMYLQDTYAPRSTKWSWFTTSAPVGSAGTDTDGDGVNDASDPFPWDPTKSAFNQGGLIPIAVYQGTVAGATPGTMLPDIFNGSGSGQFGWLSWNGDGSAPYLAQMIQDPTSTVYNNPNNPNDHRLDPGDWVNGNTGVSNSSSVRAGMDSLIGVPVTVLLWDQASGGDYHTSGFARVVMTAYSLPGKWIRAEFLGLSDRDGNLVPSTGGSTGSVVTPPSAGPVATPTPAPTSTPGGTVSVAPSPTPTPDASALPSATPTPAASATAAPTATPTATPTPVPTPAITSFSPPATAVGDQVTITGSNFDAVAANNVVSFNGTTAAIVSASATQLVVTVPTGATTGPITVACGSSVGTSATNFTVTATAAPAITSFSPGSACQTQSVTLTGRNFSATPASNTVKINGLAATVTAASATSLTVTVPNGATTGPITVTTGGLTATSATNLTITAAPVPTIASFSPGTGQPGTSVTLTGTNFDPTAANNTVKFNGTAAVVTAASATSLTVTVPAGATTGTISVTAYGNTATSASSYTVITPSNRLLPIALNSALLSGKADGAALGSISYNLGSGFCWLSWTTANPPVEATWVTAMTPGNPTASNGYVNPTNTSDTHIDVGDWINVQPDVGNANGKTGMDKVVGYGNIIVPVFSSANVSATPQCVQVSGFALIQVTARPANFNGTDSFTATFVRMCDSDGN